MKRKSNIILNLKKNENGIHTVSAGKTLTRAALLIGTIFFITGCTYSHNKGWSDMTDSEKHAARETFQRAREDLSGDFEEGSLEEALSNVILDRVDKLLDDNN